MTFDEANKVIKRGDLICLRNELEAGLSPNLSNRYSWTLLMVAAMEGNTSVGRLLIEKGADLNARNPGRQMALSLAAHAGIRHSSNYYWRAAHHWNATLLETIWTFG